jgi:glycosyltransferase involved in cell wall biosynthesis
MLGQRRGYYNVLLRLLSLIRDEGLSGLRLRIKRRLHERDHSREPLSEESYREWVSLYDTPGDAERRIIKINIGRLQYRPLFSILMPVQNAKERWLRAAVESTLKQLYPNWELCVVYDGSVNRKLRRLLEDLAGRDRRIKLLYQETNSNTSNAYNNSLSIASGDFVALFSAHDELAEHALYVVAQELNAFPEADFIYSDEDKLNSSGERCEPSFKPDWNPDLFCSWNFISHLTIYRRSVLENIGGLRDEFNDSYDYDLALRVSECVPEKNIRHIPHVLYHAREWSHVKLTFTSGEDGNGARALRSHFERTGQEVEITTGHSNSHRVIYPIPDAPPLVSLIVPTRDRVGLLRQMVGGVLKETDYSPLELIIVDNESSDPETVDYLAMIGNDKRVRVIPYNAPFNYSAINNLAVGQAQGEIIGLLNNDLKFIHSDWLREMVSHSVRPEIGVAGAKLYFADGSIQHAGIILGGERAAAHAFRGLAGNDHGYMSRAQCIQNVSAVTGACLFTRRSVFAEAGGLDEKNLPIAYNDVDFCLRVRALGYRVLWTPYAEIIHLESASRGSDVFADKLPRFLQEREYLQTRWGQTLNCDPYYNPNLTLDRDDFSLAFPPRVKSPWATDA